MDYTFPENIELLKKFQKNKKSLKRYIYIIAYRINNYIIVKVKKMRKYNNEIFPIDIGKKDINELYRETLSTWKECNFRKYTCRLKSLKVKKLALEPEPKIHIRLPHVLDEFMGDIYKRKHELKLEWKETIRQLLERMAPYSVPLNKFFSQVASHMRDTSIATTKDFLKLVLDFFVSQPMVGRPKYTVFKEMEHPKYYPRGVIAGIVSDSYLTIGDEEMLEYASNKMAEYGNFSVHSIDITKNKSEYRFMYDDTKRSIVEARKGDTIQGWISFSNNRWGRGGLNVGVGGERLVCGNGLVAPFKAQKHSIAHIKRKEETISQATNRILQDLVSNIENCFEVFDRWFADIKRATQIKVEKPIDQIVEIANRFSVSKKQTEEVIENYTKEYNEDETLYGISNAFNYDTDDENRMAIAGEILTWKNPIPIPEGD